VIGYFYDGTVLPMLFGFIIPVGRFARVRGAGGGKAVRREIRRVT
jgi:hypothetical protein